MQVSGFGHRGQQGMENAVPRFVFGFRPKHGVSRGLAVVTLQ